MGVWWRSSRKSTFLFTCLRRRCYNSTSKILSNTSTLFISDTHKFIPLIHPQSDTPLIFGRSYAASVKVKTKGGYKKRDGKQGCRLNEEITASAIRLVTDTGHQIMPMHKALFEAKKLKLDLVEVDRRADPPVCKIMDFHKEKYIKQQRDKERAKSKLEVTVRKGDCREIRFNEKTDQKDIERKAEMVKRILERGYRVKCIVMGTAGENSEEQLLRLSTLIEDVSIVESGPKVDRKGTSLIVKHIKYGGPNRKAQQKGRVVSSEEDLKEEGGRIEECSPFKQPKEVAFKVPSIDRVEGIPAANVIFTSEKEFKEHAQLEEYAPEKFKEVAAEEVPNSHRVEDFPTANFLFTSEMKMHTTNPSRQVSVAVDNSKSTKTETKLGDSIGKADSFEQARQTLADTQSIWHGRYSSYIGKQYTSEQPLEQPVDRTKARVSEILKKELSSLPLSTNFDNGPKKHDHRGHSDNKQSVVGDDLRQVKFGKIHNDPGHSVSYVGKPQSVDSISESIAVDNSKSTKTETKLGDSIGKDDSFEQARQTLADTQSIWHGRYSSYIGRQYTSEQPLEQPVDRTKARVSEILKKELSSLPLSTNFDNGPKKHDHRGHSDNKQSVVGDDLSQVKFGKIHNDPGHSVSYVGKPQSVDSISESTNGSIKANVKDIRDDNHYDVSTTSEVTRNIVEELETSPINLNSDASKQDQEKIGIRGAKISAGSLRQSLVSGSSGNQEKTGKQSLTDILLKKGNESRWSILRQNSPANLNNGAAYQQKTAIGSAKSTADSLKKILVNRSSGDQEKSASGTGFREERMEEREVEEGRALHE